MKKIKRFFRNLKWLFNNDLGKITLKRDFILKGDDLTKAEISGIVKAWEHDKEGNRVITKFDLNSVSTTFGESGNSFVKE